MLLRSLFFIFLYVPFMQELFDTFALSGLDLLIVGGAAATIVPVLELGKWMVRRGWFGRLS